MSGREPSTSRKCPVLSPSPARGGSPVRAARVRGGAWSQEVIMIDTRAASGSGLGLEGFHLTETGRRGLAFGGGAGAFRNELPGVGLVIHFRCACTGGAGAGRAVVMTFH